MSLPQALGPSPVQAERRIGRAVLSLARQVRQRRFSRRPCAASACVWTPASASTTTPQQVRQGRPGRVRFDDVEAGHQHQYRRPDQASADQPVLSVWTCAARARWAGSPSARQLKLITIPNRRAAAGVKPQALGGASSRNGALDLGRAVGGPRGAQPLASASLAAPAQRRSQRASGTSGWGTPRTSGKHSTVRTSGRGDPEDRPGVPVSHVRQRGTAGG